MPCSLCGGLQIQAAREKRQKISAHLEDLLGSDGVLMLPTAPGPAPLLKTPPAELDLFRSRLLSLTCIAGLGGLPQVLQVFTTDYSTTPIACAGFSGGCSQV